MTVEQYANSFTAPGSFGPRYRIPGYYRHVAVVAPADRFISAALDLLPLGALQLLTIPGIGTTAGAVAGAVVWLVSIAYFVFNHFYLVMRRGQTLGKMFLGHHIVHVRYSDSGWWFCRMNWRLALVRWLGHCLDLLSLPLAAVKIIWTTRRASVGDSLANTVVVPYHYYWQYTPNPSTEGGYADREG